MPHVLACNELQRPYHVVLKGSQEHGTTVGPSLGYLQKQHKALPEPGRNDPTFFEIVGAK